MADKNSDEFKATTDNEEFNSFFNYILENARSSVSRPYRTMQRNADGVYEERVSLNQLLFPDAYKETNDEE